MKGFTEWTNVVKAKPFTKSLSTAFADLGFYDLRVSETRIQQAEIAKKYGIEGFFCYQKETILYKNFDAVIDFESFGIRRNTVINKNKSEPFISKVYNSF